MRRTSQATRMAVSLITLVVLLVAGTLTAIFYARDAVLNSERLWCGTLVILVRHLSHNEPLYPAIVEQAQRFHCDTEGRLWDSLTGRNRPAWRS